ncbi:glycosyltransferase family 2 protein [Raoultibacter phocaeensis]|uniref:glycosyltransferase family 2 protein n=1 Tax=Raoultibacter phocaeensis TaxID=2479841 RepID=UPI001118FB37|nr:glycosyltransferase [Raoultibacter phocaeensis]
MGEPAVSIVIPIHNAEAYLPRCLDSLKAQTFRDCEAILVDDGSTDGSGSLCDEFAAAHENVQVIRHERARGVSAARNAGVAAARGAYVGFVDADDWAAPTLFETLYRIATETESDAAQVQYVLCSGPRTVENGVESVQVLSSEEALADMLVKEEYAVWNRIYSRRLFEACGPACFPEGLTCEDRVGNAKLLSQARRVAVSSRVEYFYFQNLGSISYNGLDARGLDLLEADRIMVETLRTCAGEQVLSLAQDRAAKSSFSLLIKWARFGVTDPDLDEESTVARLFDDFGDNYARLMKSPMSAGKKIAAWQLKHCPGLLRLEFKVLRAASRGEQGGSRG